MPSDRIEGKWIDAFCETFQRCGVKDSDGAAILSETQSRELNVHLAELALLRLGVRRFHIVVPTPRNPHPVPVRSTGARLAGRKAGRVAIANSDSRVERLRAQRDRCRQPGRARACSARMMRGRSRKPDILF